MKTYIKSIRLDSKALAQRVDPSRKTDFIKCISAAMRLTEFCHSSIHDVYDETIVLNPTATVDITDWRDPVVSWADQREKPSICAIEQLCPRILAEENITLRRAVRILNVLLFNFTTEEIGELLETFQST